MSCGEQRVRVRGTQMEEAGNDPLGAETMGTIVIRQSKQVAGEVFSIY